MQMLYNAIYKGNLEVLINNCDFLNWALKEKLVGLLIILAIWNSINITFEEMKILKSSNFDFFKVPDVTESAYVKLVSVPVNAGFPSPADDYIEDTIDLPKMLIKNPSSTYVLRVKGQSMVDAGIFDKSIIVVDASLEPVNGDIAVCIIDGDFTLKRISKVKDKLYLMPENNNFKPIEVKEGNNFEVWGILTWVLSQPNKIRK